MEGYLKGGSLTSQEMLELAPKNGILPIQKICELTDLQKQLLAYVLKSQEEYKAFLEVNNINPDELDLKNCDVHLLNKMKFLSIPSGILPDLIYSLSASEYPGKNIVVLANGVYEYVDYPKPVRLKNGQLFFRL